MFYGVWGNFKYSPETAPKIPETDRMKNKILQQLWKIACKVRELFATVAFWMGVYVLHIHQIFQPLVPWSIEGYYQKIGRAGQDGRRAIARLFFNGFKQAIRRA